MEKLEAALAKAREARRSAAIGAASVDMAAAEAKRNRPTPPTNWEQLTEVTISPEQARQSRVVALTGGKVATPYDMLRSRTIRLMKDAGWKRLAVTSPNAACGKTTLALNLALSLARQKDLRVLLIDLDLRRPNLHRLLSYAPTGSMHQVLGREIPFSEAAVRIGDNLAIGVNANASRHPAELLHSISAREVLAEIEDQLKPDYVIFDMSPMLASDDNVGFLDHVNCALLVAAAESTTLQSIDICEKELAELTNVLGVVLNKCRYADSSAGYGYEEYD
jgi:Mrp family chromosome partitioning ATPase